MSIRLLIVDDDPEMLMLISTLIREMTPYEATITNNPLEALELVKWNEFDLIIAEVKMSVLDGFAFFDAIRSINNKNIPVIFISAYGTIETALEAKQKGCCGFIMKPFRKEQLLYAIDNALKFNELKKENQLLKNMLKGMSVRGLETSKLTSG